MDDFVSRIQVNINTVHTALSSLDINKDRVEVCLQDTRQCLDRVYAVIDANTGGFPPEIFNLRDQLRTYLTRLEAISNELQSKNEQQHQFSVSSLSYVYVIVRLSW